MRVVITGASSGIGEALARHYASPGGVLGLISRRAPVAELSGTVVFYPLDVTDAAALEQAAVDFVRRFGAPDLVIARAIALRRRLAVIPWQMAAASVALRWMPGWLYDRIASRAPRKPRDVRI